MVIVSKGGESSGMSDGLLFGTKDAAQSLGRDRQMLNESLVKSKEEQ